MDKLDYYDIFSVVIPGTLWGCWILVCFPASAEAVSTLRLPDAVAGAALLVTALFLGHVVQALASLSEPFLHRTWGGRPSSRALRDGLGDRYLPKTGADRIRAKLRDAAGHTDDAQDLFLFAMARAGSVDGTRVDRFNSQYAFHRAVVIGTLLAGLTLAGSLFWGAAAAWSGTAIGLAFAAHTLLIALFWYRARQRAFYFVREVLHAAERSLDAALPR
jgi:hypothetical protein